MACQTEDYYELLQNLENNDSKKNRKGPDPKNPLNMIPKKIRKNATPMPESNIFKVMESVLEEKLKNDLLDSDET